MTTSQQAWAVLLAIPIGYLVVAGAIFGYHHERSPTRGVLAVAFNWWLQWYWPVRDEPPADNESAGRAWAWPIIVFMFGLSLVTMACVTVVKLFTLIGRTIVVVPIALGRMAGRRRPRVPRARALARQELLGKERP